MSTTSMSFSEQIDFVDNLFSSWNDCEKVVALYYLLRKLPAVQTKFLAQVLGQFVAGFSPSDDHEEKANNPVFLNSLSADGSADLGQVVKILLNCLPLLRAGNTAAKSAYLRLIPAAVQRANETGRYRNECQQVLSYALIHPAITAEELASLNPAGSQQFQAPVVASQVCRQNGTDDVSCVNSHLFQSPSCDKTSAQAAVGGSGSNALFANGGLGYVPSSVGNPLHHHHLQAAGRQLTPASSMPTAGVGSISRNVHGAIDSSGTMQGVAESPMHMSAVRRTQTATGNGSGLSADLGAVAGSNPSSFAVLAPPILTSSAPSAHPPLLLSKSAGFVSTPSSRHGTHPPSLHHGHQKLSRIAPIGGGGHYGCDASGTASVTDWLRRNVDAIGTGRWDASRSSTDTTPSSCRMSSSIEGGSLGVELLSSSSSSVHMQLSPQSSDASSGSGGGGGGGGNSATGDGYHLSGGIGGDSDDGSNAGMQDVLMWLKILRLHKYSSLFLSMTYDEMMNLSDDWLEIQGVTKGARNKILISVKKLHERPAALRQIEKDVMSSGNVRSAIDQLRQVVNTPIKACDASGELTVSNTASSLDADSSGITDNSAVANSAPAEGGRRSSESESLSDYDLPGLITRVLGKLCTQLLVTVRPDSDCLTTYLHLLDKCINHQAYTDEQKKKMLSWRQQIYRVLQFTQRQHRTAASSASLPPTSHPRHPGSQRPLRGQASTGGPTQPAWTFIGSSGSGRSSAASRHPPVGWQASAPQYAGASQSGMATSTSAFGPSRLAQLDPSPAVPTVVKMPLSRTQSAPLRSARPGVSVISPPVMENDLSSNSEDLHASLNSLCLSMMEAAMGSGLGDAS